eukprot:1493793-Prymnesium_polylepis.1
MDELHDKMQEVKGTVNGYSAYKESLFTTFDEVTDLLNSTRFAGVAHLREHGRAIAADLKAMEQANKAAPWHAAGKAIFTALFVIVGKGDDISDSQNKDVLTIVATAPDKGGEWDEVLEKLGKVTWKDPAKAMPAACWLALSEIAKVLEEASSLVEEALKIPQIKSIGNKKFGEFWAKHSKPIRRAPEALQVSKEKETLQEELDQLQDKIDTLQTQMEEVTDADDDDAAAGATRANICLLYTSPSPRDAHES